VGKSADPAPGIDSATPKRKRQQRKRRSGRIRTALNRVGNNSRPLPYDRQGPAAAKVHRSKVTNGKALFLSDVARAWERRFRDLIAYHVADLGGEAETSIGEREIIRSICAQTVEMELLEKRFALKGDGAKAEDLALYCTVANSRRRQLESIGIKRASPLRDITPPSLADIRREMDARRKNIAGDDG
jgi:hypothetical protein